MSELVAWNVSDQNWVHLRLNNVRLLEHKSGINLLAYCALLCWKDIFWFTFLLIVWKEAWLYSILMWNASLISVKAAFTWTWLGVKSSKGSTGFSLGHVPFFYTDKPNWVYFFELVLYLTLLKVDNSEWWHDFVNCLYGKKMTVWTWRMLSFDFLKYLRRDIHLRLRFIKKS